MGDTSGTNPTDTSVATYEGIAEALPRRTFERRPGTVTLVIADLNAPRVSVDMDGFAINPPKWANLPFTNGGIIFWPLTDENYLAGNFYGLEHEEAYTEAYTGAFGATRDN